MPRFRFPRPRRPPQCLVLAVVSAGCWLIGSPAAWAASSVLAVATIDQTISNITTWIVGLLAGLATLFLTIGGVRYLMAGGDPGEVEKAKGALRSAGQGYMLAILAPVIVTVLKKMVGA
ncbi:pilin [Streptacidiphilus neutrinimicus]|uniref:pilin n=1 Tax=Streptacidiphilus neutrinimicus TaxID=105420 RepID=UPI0005A77F92|nr:pilin [Streptacidiphilus neutrinimicus]